MIIFDTTGLVPGAVKTYWRNGGADFLPDGSTGTDPRVFDATTQAQYRQYHPADGVPTLDMESLPKTSDDQVSGDWLTAAQTARLAVGPTVPIIPYGMPSYCLIPEIGQFYGDIINEAANDRATHVAWLKRFLPVVEMCKIIPIDGYVTGPDSNSLNWDCQWYEHQCDLAELMGDWPTVAWVYAKDVSSGAPLPTETLDAMFSVFQRRGLSGVVYWQEPEDSTVYPLTTYLINRGSAKLPPPLEHL